MHRLADTVRVSGRSVPMRQLEEPVPASVAARPNASRANAAASVAVIVAPRRASAGCDWAAVSADFVLVARTAPASSAPTSTAASLSWPLVASVSAISLSLFVTSSVPWLAASRTMSSSASTERRPEETRSSPTAIAVRAMGLRA